MEKITVTPVTGTELYYRYASENEAQDCYVELNARTGVLRAESNGEIGNAVPQDVHYGHRMRWTIPALKADRANALLAEIAPIAQRIVDGYESRWDGNHEVAKLTRDGNAAVDEIEALCDATSREDEAVLVTWTAGEFFGVLGSYEAQAAELGITAESTDEDLKAVAHRELSNAEGVDVIDGIGPYLEKLRGAAGATRRAA